jgi:tripartite-type tricarboxylate transporter receptor subunit TctC
MNTLRHHLGDTMRRTWWAAVWLTCAACAWGQTSYPNKPIKLVVGFPSGSSADVTARILARKLGDTLGQAVVVDNKPGASSNIATEGVVRAPADGYTLLLGSVANTINAGMGKSLPFSFANDLAPITLVTSLPNILVVHPSLGVNTVQELVALAKTKPGAIDFASSGNGTSPHLSGELFNLMAGVKLSHVPYKGSSQAVTDVLSGLVPVMFAPASTALPHIQSGALKALAVTSAQRSAIAPKLPTISESGLSGYETSVWFGVLAPQSTPREVQDKLSQAINQSIAAPEVKQQLLSQGIDALGGSRADFAKYMAAETEKWERLIKASGAKFD